METVYMNAYHVDRAYGGPEEGGWWYNRGEPLASIPIPAKAIPADDCDTDTSEEGNKCAESCNCTKLIAADPAQEEKVRADLLAQFAHLNHRRIGDLGGSEVQIYTEDHFARYFPQERPHYE